VQDGEVHIRKGALSARLVVGRWESLTLLREHGTGHADPLPRRDVILGRLLSRVELARPVLHEELWPRRVICNEFRMASARV
jgi:hypothetical protein